MNDDIVFLIKFGEREHMGAFTQGHMFFSHAKRFREIEEEALIKGQGDTLEGTSIIYSVKMELYDEISEEKKLSVGKSRVRVIYEAANNIPVYCLFACYKKDCVEEADNRFRITLTKEQQADIREHFPNADTAAVVVQPNIFSKEITLSFGEGSKCGEVQYFDYGGTTLENGKVAMDINYMRYLGQDTPIIKEERIVGYRFLEENVHRCLFCKDTYFINEQEYRIVLPRNKIEKPRIFDASFTTEIKLFDIDDVLSGISIQK